MKRTGVLTVLLAISAVTYNSISSSDVSDHISSSSCTPGFSVMDTVGVLIGGNRILETADLDGDGDIDVIGGVSDVTEWISWWENDGTGSFTPHILDSIIVSGGIFARDMDLDSDPDLLHYNGFAVAWLRNDGNANFDLVFVDSLPNAGGINFDPLDAADFDNDGDIDVAAPGAIASSAFVWWENVGAEEYVLHFLEYPSGLALPWMVAVADIDSDGDMDIVGADSLQEIPWWRNDSAGVFTLDTVQGFLDTVLGFPDGIRFVHPVDLDSDSDVDVVGAAATDAAFLWWENDGSENFTIHAVQQGGSNVTWISSADLDMDGDIDILTGNPFRWYENDGNENFTPHDLPGTFSNQGGTILVADLNGDCRPDIVGTDWWGNTIVWWRNECTPMCACHADPVCDSVTDVFDVLGSVEIAFQNGTPITDPDCTRERTDVTCDGFTDVFDVLAFVAVAFQNTDPAAEFCEPCSQ